MAAIELVLPGGGRLQLWPQRAAFEPDAGLLLVADADIGRPLPVRRLRGPAPAASTAQALARLDALLAHTGARGIVFLGDFLHPALTPADAAQVLAWRRRWSALTLTLLCGARAGAAPALGLGLGLRVLDGALRIGPWALRQRPQAVPGAYVLAGQLRPGVLWRGGGRQPMRLPCFHFGLQVGVLPAFGCVSGLQLMPPALGARQYAVAAPAPGLDDGALLAVAVPDSGA